MAMVRGQLQARPQRREPEVLRPHARPSLRELLQEIRFEGTHLVRKEIELVRMELRQDVRTEAIAVGCLSAACGGGVLGGILLLVTLILGLAHVMPGWGAALIVSGAVLLASGVVAAVGWKYRVRAPLENTRQVLKGDLHWTRERHA
jgi:Putative Actinobacterial Holin-X, holin superfamily III